MWLRLILISLSLMAIGFLNGCSTPTPEGTGSLTELEAISANRAQAYHANSIRYTALKDTALSLGAQAGLAFRARQINAGLELEEKHLNQTYDFYSMLLDHDVLPPVLAEADTALNLADPYTIRIAQKIYKIQSQAHFVTAPPTWRDYLWMHYAPPPVPDNSLLPRNHTERKFWDHYVAMGWGNGIQQANQIFSANLARLDRDYKGMVLYRKLYSENMVSAPFVVKTNLGITGNHSRMNIGDQILRITALPQLNLNGNTWEPAIIPTDTGRRPLIYVPHPDDK